jgi:hypothetical protein
VAGPDWRYQKAQIDAAKEAGVAKIVLAGTDKQAEFGIAHTELRAKRQRSAQDSGRHVECPYRVAGKASALSAGSDIPKSYCAGDVIKRVLNNRLWS